MLIDTSAHEWVVWRYECRGTKWTKVPYTPGTASQAASNRPSSWRTFAEAVACYRERPDFFDGIGYMFAKAVHCRFDGYRHRLYTFLLTEPARPIDSIAVRTV